MMKTKLLSLFALVLTPFVNAQMNDLDIHNYCGKACYFKDKPSNFQSFGADKSVVPNNYDIIHQTLAFETDPAIKYINGYVATTFIPASSINEIYFDCSNSLIVDSVYYNGSSITFAQQPGNALLITFPTNLTAGTEYIVTVYYQGVPDNSGMGSFANETHNSVPVSWTLSEPYGAKDWWPCKQSLNDKIDSIDIIITTPIAYRAGSNGVIVSETTTATKRTIHWKHRFPIPAYLVAFAATNYAVYTDVIPVNATDTIFSLNYVYPENLTNAQTRTQAIHGMFNVFNEIGGVYPYISEKYGHMEFNWGGGMEHTTMSSMGGFDVGLMAHELAHQWFGNMITCASWVDIWLNEGFASYLTGIVRERNYPNSWMQWRLANKNLVLSQPGGSVKVNDTTDQNRIFDSRLTYSKGGYILHQLRWILGDEDFFQAVYNYAHDPALRHNYATTPDLIAHFEAVSGKNLAYYFEDWYEGEGFPVYDIVWSQNALNKVTIQLDQTPTHSSVSFFELPIPIRFRNNNKDTIVVFNHTTNGQTFEAQLDFTATALDFDPELWTLARLNQAVLSVNENSALEVVVFPNPAIDKVYVKFQQAHEIQSVSLVDYAGKIVWRQHDVTTDNLSIAVDQLAAGMYIIQIQLKDFHTIIKQKVTVK